MLLKEIKNHAIIIAPTPIHHQIRKQLLLHEQAVIDVCIQSIETLFNPSFTDTTTYEYYTRLLSIKDKVHYQTHSLTSLTFIDELKQFVSNMKQYDIHYDQLPCNDEIEEELAFIITHVYDIPLAIDTFKSNLDTFTTNKQLYIVDTYTTSYETLVHDKLYDMGAIKIPYTSNTSKIEYYSVLNKRKEVEALAQYIIKNDIDVKDAKISILSNDYIPFIKSIFNFYKIPTHIQNDTYIPFILQKFIHLLEYAIQPTQNNLIELFKHQAIKTTHTSELVHYMQTFELGIEQEFTHVRNSQISSDIIDKYDYKRLCTLEEKAQEARKQALPMLSSLIHCDNIEELLNVIDSYLLEHHEFKTSEDRAMMLHIRQEMRHSIRHLNNKDELRILSDILSNKSSSFPKGEGIQITSLKDAAFHYNYHFVLGCTQSNYPAMSTFNSIFKEDYYRCIPPLTLENRYMLHLHNLEKQLHTSTHLVCFYPLSTFDGKGKETSLELDNILHTKPISIAVLETNHEYKKEYTLDKSYAKQLFYQDNILNGSISSLETYAKCPYSYFLKYGLKLREKVNTSFDETKAGTLIHYMMEHLLNEYQNEYTHTNKEAIKEILQTKIDELITVFPNKEVYLTQLALRLMDTITTNLKVLDTHEANNVLKEHLNEYKFNYDVTFDQLQLHLYGYIDRIDYNEDFFRIMDYKSSPKTLKEDDVFSAIQLQLMTYLVVMEEVLSKKPLGAFYYSLHHANTKMEYAKLKKRPLGYQFYKEDDKIDAFHKTKKLDGWICSEHVEVLDESGTYIKGMSTTKAHGLSAKTIYDYDHLKSYVLEIYRQLTNDILDAKIDCVSVEHACTYCPYASLCLHNNQPKNKKEMIEVSEELYLKGGRKNA